MNYLRQLMMVTLACFVAACGSSGEGDFADDQEVPAPGPNVDPDPLDQTDPLDVELRELIATRALTGDPVGARQVPDLDDPLARLGMLLFFSKSLGGQFDAACASCHHPSLAGADELSLPVGVNAVDPDLLGQGRFNSQGIPIVPRNSPTSFNVALWDSGLFWDSRVESLGKELGQNGAASGISTPDSGTLIIDTSAGANLAIAQARFPVTSDAEMRGDLDLGADNDSLRGHLAARIGNYGAGLGEIRNGRWLAEFRSAFSSSASAEQLVTFENIVAAIGRYERSQTFVQNPWRDYVAGDNDAIGDQAKRGALLFLTSDNNGGASCFECHSGDKFSDERHHAVGTPQFGPGKGNTNNNDFGRENITENANDRFRFRTPSLLNVATTAPYTHTGAYETLGEIVAHYNNPRGRVDDFFDNGGWCQLAQYEFVVNCASLYPNAESNSNLALNKVTAEQNQNDPDALPNIGINNQEQGQIVAFLNALTDPCVEDANCVSAWIPGPQDAPDAHQLDAIDESGNPL